MTASSSSLRRVSKASFCSGDLAGEGRHFHAGACGEFVERLLEIEVLALHHELEDVAALVALTEAPPRAGLGPDHEGGRLLVVVERTEARIVLPGMAQFDTSLGDEVYDVDAGFDLINGGHR
jgi:hypothetical protein